MSKSFGCTTVLLWLASLSYVAELVPAETTYCQPDESVRSQNRGGATRVTFQNNRQKDVTLYWVSGAGKETDMGNVFGHGGQQSMNSFVGHVFRVKAKGSDEVLLQHVVAAEDEHQTVSIVDCEGKTPKGDISKRSTQRKAGSPSAEETDLYGHKYGRDAYKTGQLKVPREWKTLKRSKTRVASKLLKQGCAHDQLLSHVRNPGFHVLCVTPNTRKGQSDEDSKAERGLILSGFKDGLHSERATVSFQLPAEIHKCTKLATKRDMMRCSLYSSLDDLLDLFHYEFDDPPKGGHWQRAALFTKKGYRIQAVHEVLEHSEVVFITGGQWIWPGVKVGHAVEVGTLRYPHEVTVIRTLSLQPKVFEVLNFLRPEECSNIMKRAEPHMAHSGVAYMDHDVGKPVQKFRTSSTHFLSSRGDVSLEDVEHRVQMLTRIPVHHAEDTQVLRYRKDEYYHAHHDYFNPKFYQKHHMLKTIQGGANNRLATVFFYLTNVSDGGETNFPRAGGLPQPPSMADCSRGLSVRPQANKVIIFYSLFPSGDGDDLSLHGACDVINGTKWSANFWLWNKPYNGRNQGGSTRHVEAARALDKPVRVLEKAEEEALSQATSSPLTSAMQKEQDDTDAGSSSSSGESSDKSKDEL